MQGQVTKAKTLSSVPGLHFKARPASWLRCRFTPHVIRWRVGFNCAVVIDVSVIIDHLVESFCAMPYTHEFASASMGNRDERVVG
jgi:hypothetical protein